MHRHADLVDRLFCFAWAVASLAALYWLLAAETQAAGIQMSPISSPPSAWTTLLSAPLG